MNNPAIWMYGYGHAQSFTFVDFMFVISIAFAASMLVAAFIAMIICDKTNIYKVPLLMIFAALGIFYGMFFPHNFLFFFTLHFILAEIGRPGMWLVSAVYHIVAFTAFQYAVFFYPKRRFREV